MKQLLLLASTVVLSVGVFAQSCTSDPQYIGSPAGLYPAGALGPTCELTAHKTIVSLTDTLVGGVPLVNNAILYITRMRINSVTGIPSGLLLGTDVMASADQDAPWGYWDNTGTWPNQTAAFGCAYVYGSNAEWDSAIDGGPNSDGVYPLVFEVDAYVAGMDPDFISFIGGAQWVSTIDPSVGGGAFLILDTLVVNSEDINISTTIAGNSNVNPLTSEIYSVPNDPDVTYNWIATNGTITGGQGTNEVTVEWNGSGNIQVDLSDDGCQGTDNMDVTANPTGLDEVAGINASVYPNPSNGLFNLRLENTDELSVRIMDISGKVLRSNQLSGSRLYTVDMQTAPSGVYVLELESAKGKTYKRLIKQ
jgi:hypothetical protein